MMNKFCVVGAGSIGTLALLETILRIKYEEKLNSATVTLIHDPNQPKISVGESSTLCIPDNIINIFGQDKGNEILQECKITLRNKSKIFWHSNNFDIDYQQMGGVGIHFDSSVFSDVVISKCLEFDFVNVIEKRIDIDEIKQEYDFIFDCSGRPSKEELDKDYIQPKFSSVNSVLLYPHFKEYNEDFTSQISHKNGWMFGVPLQHRKAYGYLYNNTITTEEEARDEFKKLIPFQEEVRKLSWDYYYRKRLIDDNIMYLGNRLYFFEPAQAIPIHFYHSRISSFFTKYLIEGEINNEGIENLNTEYNYYVRTVLDLIALNYVGSIQDSPFWNTTKEKAKQHLFSSQSFQTWLRDVKDYNIILPYSSHSGEIMRKYIEGYRINLDEL